MANNRCAVMIHWRQTNLSPGARVAPTILEADRLFTENGAFVIVMDAERKTYIPTDLVAMIEVSQTKGYSAPPPPKPARDELSY